MTTHQVLADFEEIGGTTAISYNSDVGYGDAVLSAPSGRIVIGAEVKVDTSAEADQLSQIYAIVESDGSGAVIEAWPHNGSMFSTINVTYFLYTAIQVALTV